MRRLRECALSTRSRRPMRLQSCFNRGCDTKILSRSISGPHKPSGISLTLVAAREFTDGTEGRYEYVKLGYDREFFQIGSTASSVDYYFGHAIAATDSDRTSFGLAGPEHRPIQPAALGALARL